MQRLRRPQPGCSQTPSSKSTRLLSGRPRHHVDFVAGRRHAGRQVGREAANAAEVVRRILLRKEADRQALAFHWHGREGQELSRVGRRQRAVIPFLVQPTFGADLDRLFDLIVEAQILLLGDLAFSNW